MDYPILLSASRALRIGVLGMSVSDLRQDQHRFRLVFAATDGLVRSLVISIEPTRPWMGRPAARAARRYRNRSPSPFESLLRRSLVGLVLRDLTLAGDDQAVALCFSDGQSLHVELARHRSNVTLVGAEGVVVGSARALRPSSVDTPAPPPLSAPEIDERIERLVGQGLDREAAFARALRGIGSEARGLMAEEVRGSGRSAGEILVERLARIADGRIEPLVLAPEDPRGIGADSQIDRRQLRLLPWPPPTCPPGLAPFRGADASETVGLFHEAVDGIESRANRRRTIAVTLAGEERRVLRAIDRARDDLCRFEGGETHRHHGEALLAGLTRAVRAGGAVRVPDPYAIDGREITIPVPPERPLTQCAEECFRRHRRAVRGQEHARSRLEFLDERLRGLRGVSALLASGTPEAAVRAEERLIELGIAVDLALGSQPGRSSATPRTAGVRVFAAPGGMTVLAGRSGVGNDRLTFRLASSEDIWLHAAGTAGAHVILRGIPASKDPDPEALRFAAGIAAWFSEARNEGAVDVQWTRRRLVRRHRGGRAGSVLVKRFRVIRVRPAAPQEVDESRRDSPRDRKHGADWPKVGGDPG